MTQMLLGTGSAVAPGKRMFEEAAVGFERLLL